MDPEAEPLPQPATSCRLDENLKYLAQLDVGSSQKAILLALITLAPKSSKQVEAALDRLDSLIGLKRQTLRGHLRALGALGVLANCRSTRTAFEQNSRTTSARSAPNPQKLLPLSRLPPGTRMKQPFARMPTRHAPIRYTMNPPST